MEKLSALLALCGGNSPVTGEFPAQRPVTRNFDVFFDLRPDKQLSKHLRGWWFETPSGSFWRHRNVFGAKWQPDPILFIRQEILVELELKLKKVLRNCIWKWRPQNVGDFLQPSMF